jgi:hypothetical protein
VNRRVQRAAIAPAAVLTLLVAITARAGTICGTIRDGATLQPVPQAGVFLFDQLDQYTGRYAGTDPSGHYCIDGVPTGTYTIQVRVDDYLAAVVHGIVVDDATSVDITTRAPVFLAPPWPNPARNDVTFHLDAPAGVATRLEVYDVRGRLVMGWSGDGPGGGRTIHWNLRDLQGEAVASGIYLIRLRAGGSEIVHRLVRLR